MFKANPIKTIVSVCFLAIAASGCAPEEAATDSPLTSAKGLLGHVPSDTPYVFAMVEPLPDDVADKFEPKVDAMLKTFQGMLRTIVQSQAEEDADAEQVTALLEELAGLLSVEGLRSAGVDRDSTMVLYGAGLLPVMRMTLTDGDLLDAAIARMEEAADQSMAVATIAGQSYRHAGDDKAELIIAIVEDEVVLSIVPANVSDELLKTVLGLSPPSSSIADTAELQKIVDDNGFLSHSVGLVDIERIVSTFLDDQSGVNAELLALVEFDGSQLSDVCKSEIRTVSGIAPRVVTGYTEMSTDEFTSNTILELRSDIAAGLAKLSAPVPGLGSEQGGLLSFGMSIDLLAAREFYAARLDAMEAEPYQCELFAEWQDGVAKGREALNQPVPPIAYGFKGFLAVVEDIKGMNLASKQPPTSADLRVLVSTDNAEGLLAMGAMFSPEIAALDLQPDGVPVKFESSHLAGKVEAAHVAMTENALAVSIGAGTEVRLGDMLTAAISEPPPFMSMEMDAAQYYDFLAQAVTLEDDEEDKTPPEVRAAIGEMMRTVGDMFSRISFDIEFTDRGVEFPSTILLAD
ncbi:MAG: hypothetical protein ACE5KS_04385 [Woeseiaceae bacterium]